MCACVRVCPLPRCLSSGPLLRCGERTSDRSDDGPCASYSSILDAAHAHARNHSPGPAISLQAVVNGGDNLVLKVVRIDAVEAARLQNLEDVNEGAFCALSVTKGTQSMVHHLLPTSGLFPTVGFLSSEVHDWESGLTGLWPFSHDFADISGLCSGLISLRCCSTDGSEADKQAEPPPYGDRSPS